MNCTFLFCEDERKKWQIFMEPSCKTHIYISKVLALIFFCNWDKNTLLLYLDIFFAYNLRSREEECLVPTAFWVLGLQFYLPLTLSISIYVFAFANESNIVAVLISFAGWILEQMCQVLISSRLFFPLFLQKKSW